MTRSQPIGVVGADPQPRDDGAIAVAVLTHDRQHLLQQCVERVLLRASEQTREIVIWNNASTDSTRDYLDSLDDPRVRVVHSEQNVGQSGYARAFKLTQSPYLIELDDDVVDAPDGWDVVLRDAYQSLPSVGFLAADLEDDPLDQASHYRHHVRPDAYVEVVENGVRLFRGPTGGACAITSRELYDRIGGFSESSNEVFFLEDMAYIAAVERVGLSAAVLADLQVHHAGAPYYTTVAAAKLDFYARRYERWSRRNTVKRVLYKLPLVARLNPRFEWFAAPVRGEELAKILELAARREFGGVETTSDDGQASNSMRQEATDPSA